MYRRYLPYLQCAWSAKLYILNATCEVHARPCAANSASTLMLYLVSCYALNNSAMPSVDSSRCHVLVLTLPLRASSYTLSHTLPAIKLYILNATYEVHARPYAANSRTRTRTNTNPNDTEANAAGRSGNARALRKQASAECIMRGRGIGQNSRKNCKKRGICG